MERLTAAQARAQMTPTEQLIKQRMEALLKKIDILSKEGYDCITESLLYPEEVKQLEELGYKAEFNPNTLYKYKISW